MTATLASVIRARRLVRGIEQAALAASIGCDPRSVARWETGELPSARHMTGLRAALDLTITEMDALVLAHVAGDGTRMRGEGPGILDRVGWSYGDLLDRVLDLELRATGIEGARFNGTSATWSAIFEALPESWRVLTRGDRVVGVWHLVPLRPPAYAAFRAGRLADGDIGTDDIETLDLPGAFDATLCSVAIDRSVRSPRTFALLVSSLLEVVTGFADRGIELRSICAQAWTPSVMLLCRRLGFQEVATLIDAPWPVPVLETRVARLLSHPALATLMPGGGTRALRPAG